MSTTAIDSKEYDTIYTEEPDKWSDLGRDLVAREIIKEFYGIPKTILDVGCGNGHTISLLHETWPDTKYTGLDISPVACRLARENAPYADIYNTELGFLEMQFDAITAMGVVEHFKDIVDGMKELKRHMNPGGVLYIECPDNLAMSGRTEEGWFGSSIQTEWHLKRSTWVEKFEEAGLKVIHSFSGTMAYYGFIWLLGKADANAGQ